jgi:hypothetical protein
MKLAKLLGIVLVAAGVLALVYKGFNYTEETHKARLGPLELAVKEKERVSIPTWAGVAAIAAGAALLLVPGRR